MVSSGTEMTNRLSDADWEELSVLIENAPPDRLKVAMSRLRVPTNTDSESPHLAIGAERLLHLATISSGDAFDRALLKELRRLSVH